MSCGWNVYLVRQISLEIAICLISFSTGISLAFPSILNPAILAPDSDVKVTSDQASWIAACLGVGSLIGYSYICASFEIFGRRIAMIVTNLSILVGSLILFTANDVYSLAISRIFQGSSIAGAHISGIVLSECVSPKRRGYFMVLHKVSMGLGSLACHGLVIVLNWRQIALLGAFGNLISIIIFTMSAESPPFLAMRGQFDKCVEAFEWYRGDSLNAKKELKELVVAQTERQRIKERQNDVSAIKKLKDIIMTKEFQKSFYIVTLATLCLDSCGRYFVLAYITQILLELIKNATVAMYLSIATDCVLIFALGLSSLMVKQFKRRTLLFKLGFSSVFLMFMVSFSIILSNQKWFTLVVMLIHIFVINLSLIPVVHALAGEVFPLEYRGLGTFMSGFVFSFFFNIVMKATPILIDKTGVQGTYFVYGIFLLLILSLMRIVLPETKDKTLQQIENEIKGIVKNNSEVELIEFAKVSNCK